jgi:hypothetical protein
MKNFNIEVVSKKPKKINKELVYIGRITIGDFQENFHMPLDSWTVEEYKQQWKEGLERIKTHDSSCLIVTISRLKTNPFIIVWLLYKVNNIIFIQNQLLVSEILKEIAIDLPPYDAKTCYQYVTPRETISEEDGRKISEWQINVSDIPEL